MSASLCPSTTTFFTSSPEDMFSDGSYKTDTKTLNPDKNDAASPPKPVLIAYPVINNNGDGKVMEEEFGVLLLLHGYMLTNDFYSQLMCHVASHGFIVVAPQLHSISGSDATPDITAAAEVTNWIKSGSLATALHPHNIIPDLTRVSLSGHSRGGKAAFGLALGVSSSSSPCPLKLSSIIGIDPVDGTVFTHTTPKILSLPFDNLQGVPKMVIGSGLDVEKKACLSCTPNGLNYVNFYQACCENPGPVCYFVVKGYGHMDVLDDKTRGVRGGMSYVMCNNGSSREPMRRFVGGAVVAHVKAYLDKDETYLNAIRDGKVEIPVQFDAVDFRS